MQGSQTSTRRFPTRTSATWPTSLSPTARAVRRPAGAGGRSTVAGGNGSSAREGSWAPSTASTSAVNRVMWSWHNPMMAPVSSGLRACLSRQHHAQTVVTTTSVTPSGVRAATRMPAPRCRAIAELRTASAFREPSLPPVRRFAFPSDGADRPGRGSHRAHPTIRGRPGVIRLPSAPFGARRPATRPGFRRDDSTCEILQTSRVV
jgi:hypothetical protein